MLQNITKYLSVHAETLEMLLSLINHLLTGYQLVSG